MVKVACRKKLPSAEVYICVQKQLMGEITLHNDTELFTSKLGSAKSQTFKAFFNIRKHESLNMINANVNKSTFFTTIELHLSGGVTSATK